MNKRQKKKKLFNEKNLTKALKKIKRKAKGKSLSVDEITYGKSIVQCWNEIFKNMGL